jgi:hypothetical protein
LHAGTAGAAWHEACCEQGFSEAGIFIRERGGKANIYGQLYQTQPDCGGPALLGIYLKEYCHEATVFRYGLARRELVRFAVP